MGGLCEVTIIWVCAWEPFWKPLWWLCGRIVCQFQTPQNQCEMAALERFPLTFKRYQPNESQKYSFSAKMHCNHTLHHSGSDYSCVQVWLLHTGQFGGYWTHNALFDSFIVIWTTRRSTVRHCSCTDVFLTGRTLSLPLLLLCNSTCMYNRKQPLHIRWGFSYCVWSNH